MKNKSNLRKKHNPLFTSQGLNLGRIHWYFVRAYGELQGRRKPARIKSGKNPFMRLSDIPINAPDGTKYDDEVGADEIRWWVFKKESDIEDLYQRVEKVLPSVQKLKVDAAALLKTTPKSYEAIIESLAKFAKVHGAEILELKKFAAWLHKRNAAAPIILYSSKVWSDTRRNERNPELEADKLGSERLSVIERLTEMAFGLVQLNEYTLDVVRADIEYEMHQDRDQSDSVPQTAWPIIYAKTANQVFREFAIYFELIRNSLRNIKIEIDSYRANKSLLTSEPFWKRFITKAMPDTKAETQLWDFKEMLDIWHVPNGPAKAEAEVKFCEHVAAWANARGGVFIVGITDRPRKVKGIADLENRLKSTRAVLNRHIRLKPDLVHFQQVTLKDDVGIDRTCLIIVVAQTKDVVSVKDTKGRYSFPVREESGLVHRAHEDVESDKRAIHRDNFDFIQELEQFTNEP